MMERAERVIRENQRQMQQTAAKLMTAQDEERRRIARELHDDYCQRLAALILEVGLLPRRHPGAWTNPGQQLQPIKATLSTFPWPTSGISVMTCIPAKRPPSPWIKRYGRISPISWTKRASKPPLSRVRVPSYVPAPISTCLYRITQEGLTNIRKHAKATQGQRLDQ